MAKDRLLTCSSCGQLNRVDEEKIAQGLQPKCGRCKNLLSLSTSPIQLTDATFGDLVEKSAMPVLVDFWAPWCGPCHALAPVIEQLASEFDGKIRIGKLDTDENPRTSSRFQVQSIPTLILFANGKEVDRLIGVRSKQEITSRIQRTLL